MGLASDGLGSNPEPTLGQVTVYFQISYVREKKKRVCVTGGVHPPPPPQVLQEADPGRFIRECFQIHTREGRALQSCPESGADAVCLGKETGLGKVNALQSRTILEEGWGLSGWQQLGKEVLQW